MNRKLSLCLIGTSLFLGLASNASAVSVFDFTTGSTPTFTSSDGAVTVTAQGYYQGPLATQFSNAPLTQNIKGLGVEGITPGVPIEPLSIDNVAFTHEAILFQFSEVVDFERILLAAATLDAAFVSLMGDTDLLVYYGIKAPNYSINNLNYANLNADANFTSFSSTYTGLVASRWVDMLSSTLGNVLIIGTLPGQSGEFATLPGQPAPIDLANTNDGFRVSSIEYQQVPEPASMTLAAAGLLGLFGTAKRRKKA